MNNELCCSPLTDAPLSETEAIELSGALKALADPSRLRILSYIADRDEICACEPAEPLGLAQPTVSHHLKVLTVAGFLDRTQRGKWAYYRVDEGRLRELADLLIPRDNAIAEPTPG